jgi:ATPase family associated with various cellular activities (AAA)
LYDYFLAPDSQSRTVISSIIEAMLASELREDDMFQIPVLLYTILKVDSDQSMIRRACQNPEISAKVERLIAETLASRPQRRDGESQAYSDYIIFTCCQVFAELHSRLISNSSIKPIGLPCDTMPQDTASQLSLALIRSAETSFNELCRQLAYRSAGDTSLFDVMRLAYSLLTYQLATQTMTGTAGRELVPGQGPSPGTKLTPVNRRLVQTALAAFFEEQMPSGLWDKGQPIYKSFRRQGRNVGNAFIFAVDTVASLLAAFPAEDFRPHLGALEKMLSWIECHLLVDVITDYCDAETGQCFGKSIRGWASPHLTPGTGPQAWSTAQVVACISLMRSTIQELMTNDVLNEFQGVYLSENGPRSTAWNRLLDSDLGNPLEPETCRTIKSVLEERMIIPFSGSIKSPGFGSAYSAILFGPPGTAKTTICESLAQQMGWDFVVIDTAAFLADGLTNVASRIRYVFERLQRLNECVILFDEIEEFCLDRETPGLGMESRMLTTAMLTAINDLRRQKRSIFFLATNRLRAFDSAITRAGRFDLQLFVGTPNLESRVIQLQQKLVTVAANETTKEAAVESYRNYLSSVWTEDAMFMNFLEGAQFASACANIVASGSELTQKAMERILKQQIAVMTVRGTVRDEYKASMDMSRM